MKLKYLAAGLVLLVLVGAASPWFLNRLGTFLVVDEKAGEVDAVVAGRVSGKALSCYKEGLCKKIIVGLQQKNLRNWAVLKRFHSEGAVRDRARLAGIKDEDLYMLKMGSDNDLRWTQMLGKFFAEKKIRSVLFLVSYYKTRRYRFYFNRALSGSETRVYVQPCEKEPSVYGWWKETIYANYFLSEYLQMGWYVFNKLLWTSAV